MLIEFVLHLFFNQLITSSKQSIQSILLPLIFEKYFFRKKSEFKTSMIQY